MMKRCNGFTLIELMVTLAVLAIVITVAIPGFNDLIRNNRTDALSEEFVSALNFARLEAVKRTGRVSLCASDDGEDCNNADWTKGWIVFVDYANAENAAPLTVQGGQRNILKRWNKAAVGSEIAVKSNNNAVNFIRFTGLGTLARVNNPPTPVVIDAKLQGCKGDRARQLTVGLSGMVHVAKTNCTVNP